MTAWSKHEHEQDLHWCAKADLHYQEHSMKCISQHELESHCRKHLEVFMLVSLATVGQMPTSMDICCHGAFATS